MCVLFLAPFVSLRRPWRMLHLDLLVLVAGFSVSLAFFNAGRIGVSVPLVYPRPALPARPGWPGCARRRETTRDHGPFPLTVPVTWLLVGLVFLVGFRVGLNLTNSNVIDVGYSGVIGADRLTARRDASTATSPPTTSTATPTVRSPTTPTCRSSRSSRGAGPGTTCPRPTARPSRSTCWPSPGCGCSAGACAARAWASCSPTPGPPVRSRSWSPTRTRTTPSSPCS